MLSPAQKYRFCWWQNHFYPSLLLKCILSVGFAKHSSIDSVQIPYILTILFLSSARVHFFNACGCLHLCATTWSSVCKCICVLGHVCVCAHIWSQRTTSGIILRSPPTFSEIRPFSGPELTINLDWLTGQPQGPLSLLSQPAGCKHSTTPPVSMQHLGSEPSLHTLEAGESFTNWASSARPRSWFL